MPLRLGKKKYKSFAAAKRAVAKKGIRNPGAYVATVERLIAKRRKAKRARGGKRKKKR